MVCDTIDAMTTARPYRGPLPIDIVRQELQKHSGAQFDADLIKIVLDSEILQSLDHLEARATGDSVRLVQPVMNAEAG